MINKIQTTFILVTMAIILAVFSTIFCGLSFFMDNTIQRIANENIEKTVESYNDNGFDPANPKLLPNCLLYIIETNTHSYDENAFTKKEVNEILELVTIDHVNNETVKKGNFFYPFSIIKNENAFVAINMTQSIEIMKSNTTKILIVLIVIYLILFLFVWLISYRVFAPIKKALKKQNQFISDASHELKTPIAIISANADVIKQSGENQWVDNIKSQTNRLNNLVADMLTLAKMDERDAPLYIEEFNISNVVTDTLLPFDAVAFEKNKNLIFNITPNVIYKGDKNSVKKIVNILTDNAIKHASERGDIIVELKNEDKKIIFSVYNSGCSIPDEQTEKIFERFYRGDDSRSRESGGSGLGLAIAKSIANMNKWKLNAKSKQNEYMKITLVIPQK